MTLSAPLQMHSSLRCPNISRTTTDMRLRVLLNSITFSSMYLRPVFSNFFFWEKERKRITTNKPSLRVDSRPPEKDAFTVRKDPSLVVTRSANVHPKLAAASTRAASSGDSALYLKNQVNKKDKGRVHSLVVSLLVFHQHRVTNAERREKLLQQRSARTACQILFDFAVAKPKRRIH